MTALHPAFTPTAADPAALEAITVGREELLRDLVDRLRLAATTGNRTHTLVVGPRGSGKTHVLTVALNRALGTPDVAGRLAIAWIPEDALAISSYRDLLVELIRQVHPAAAARSRELRRTASEHDLERLLLEASTGRALVLVVENLNRVFDALGTVGASALRGFVETDGLALMASAPLLFPAVQRREEPWFGSFNVERLAELTLADGTEIMRRRAAARGDQALADFVSTPKGQAGLAVIERLAGGSPRLWHVLSESVYVSSLDKLIPAVEKLMDELAPYYQQRLWELPPGEQKLVVELARQDGMQPVSELAHAAGTSERVAAAALGRLIETQWVRRQKAPTGDQPKTWYELREPLLLHYLQYREGRRAPLRALVGALQTWFETPCVARHLQAATVELSPSPWTVARSVNGDDEAILRLSSELRGPVQSILDAERSAGLTPSA